MIRLTITLMHEEMVMNSQSGFPRYIVSLALPLLIALSPDAYAVKRILLVGDSWAQWPWNMGSYQSVLNYNYGTGTYEVEGTYTALGGTTADQWPTTLCPRKAPSLLRRDIPICRCWIGSTGRWPTGRP